MNKCLKWMINEWIRQAPGSKETHSSDWKGSWTKIILH